MTTRRRIKNPLIFARISLNEASVNSLIKKASVLHLVPLSPRVLESREDPFPNYSVHQLNYERKAVPPRCNSCVVSQELQKSRAVFSSASRRSSLKRERGSRRCCEVPRCRSLACDVG